MTARHEPIGAPKHKGEASAIQFLVNNLPDDYVVVSNIDLPTGKHGRTFDHDVIVIAPHAVFTVELKNWGGLITGNRDRWKMEWSGYVQSPIPLTLDKARVLKSVLAAYRRSLGGVWVQGLVFVSAPDADLHLTRDFEEHARTRRDVINALTNPSLWGLSNRRLTREQAEATLEFVTDGQPPTERNHFGEFELLEQLPAENRPYDAYLAKTQFGMRRLVHVYPVHGENEKARERSRNHALREATLVERISGHADILQWYGSHTFAHDNVVVLAFEDVTSLLPLSTWTAERRPGLEERLRVALRIARAVGWMHGRKVVHRRLSAEAVLLSPDGEKLRVTALDLARDLTGSAATLTASRLKDPSYRSMAPELLKGRDASVASDLFAFGVLLIELLIERPLFAKAEDVLRDFDVPVLHVAGHPVPDALQDLVGRLLARDPGDRPEAMDTVIDRIDECLGQARPSRRHSPPPIRKGAVLHQYRLEKELAQGASGTTWLVRHLQEDRNWIAKIADAERQDALRQEQEILQQVRHPNLVEYKDLLATEVGGLMLILGFVEGVTGAEWAGAGDPLGPELLLRVGEGIFGALAALHSAGYVHRDVKPANLMMRDDATPVLIDLGLGTLVDDDEHLTVGTVSYKDPSIYDVGRWTPEFDLFAAWTVLYEVATGVHPFDGRPESGRHPSIDTSLFSDHFAERQLAELGTLFEAALHPDRSRRPDSAGAALERLRKVLGQPTLPLPQRATTARIVPDDAGATTPVDELSLSVRAHRALRREGLLQLGQLAAADSSVFAGLNNVGKKTLREIERLLEEAKERFPHLSVLDVAPPSPPPALFPSLVSDERPVDEIGKALTAKIEQGFSQLGVVSIGDLAALDKGTLTELPGVGPKKVREIMSALERLAGITRPPADLKELDQLLEAELGSAAFGVVSQLVGLADCKVRSRKEVAETFNVSRQRVEQVADVESLRKQGSAAAPLLETVKSLLPSAGFARLEDVARSLDAKLPTRPGACALGHARLAAVLLEPDRRLLDLERIELVCRPPWTADIIKPIVKHLAGRVSWPPLSRQDAADVAWDATPEDVRGALRRWGVEAQSLLAALRPLLTDVLATRDEALFTPPVQFDDAVTHYRGELQPPVSLETLVARLERTYGAVIVPKEVAPLLDRHDLVLRDGVVVERNAPPPAPVVIPKLDDGVAQTVRQRPDGLDLGVLVAAAERGGFRVVVLPPAAHHRMVDGVCRALSSELGADRVELFDVDRFLLETLEHGGLWEDAEFFEKQGNQEWGWARPSLVGALEVELKRVAAPQKVTVLGRPSLLGPLGLLEWLAGFYDEVRGGQRGLFVFALPGGIRDGRVRLNEQYSFPYTPDMAALNLLNAPAAEAS